MTNDKDIILVACPAWEVKMPLLSLAYLSADLRARKIRVGVLDLNIDVYEKVSDRVKELWNLDNSKHWCDWDSFVQLKQLLKNEVEYCVEKILSFSNTNIYGFSVYASNRLFTIEVIKQIKESSPDKIIVVGGRGCLSKQDREQIFPQDIIDFFLLGEGEPTLFKLVNKIKENCLSIDIPGVVSRMHKGNNFETPQFVNLLDSLNYPTFEEFNLEKYTEKALPLLMSRGCINRCAFCDDWRATGKYRIRTAENMFEEIKYHVEKNKISNFYFNDALINGNINELEKLCDLIIGSKYKLTWIALAIARRQMRYPLLYKMRKAGCLTLNYGIESGSNKVLKKMRKPLSIDIIEEVLRDTRKAGINTQLNFILGFPGETEADVEQTIEFIKKNRNYISGVTNINTCNAVRESDCSINSEKYGIFFPSSPELRDSHWYTADGNNFKARKRRTERVISVLKDLDIQIFSTNLIEKSTDLQAMDFREKMADILLVALPPWGVNNPPIGLAYLASYLKRYRLNPKVYDFNVYFHNTIGDGFKMLWHVENKNFWNDKYTFSVLLDLFKEQLDYCVDALANSATDIIGFSVVDPRENITIEVIRRLKEKAPYKRIILGGPSCSTEYQRRGFLDNVGNDIDAFVVGEGEETLLEIIKRINQGEELTGIAGAVTKEDNHWIYNRRGPLDLEKAPFPTYEEFDLENYHSNAFLVEWSRGCRGKCSFCKNFRLAPGYRMKKVESIVEELSHHVNKYGIKKFTVSDNLLNGDPEELSKICDCIKERDLRISWDGQIAPSGQMRGELFKRMKESGCDALQIGLESASDKVLKKMRKIYTSQEAEQTIQAAKQAGIKTEVFVMIGFPGEGQAEFEQTVDFIKRNADYIDTIKSINTLHLIAGTEVYEKPERFGLVAPLPEKDWHYLWRTEDGNTWPVRRERGERLLKLALGLGMEVKETNLREGKELNLGRISEELNKEERINNLKVYINELQDLKKPSAVGVREQFPEITPGAIFIRRPLRKKIILFFLFVICLLFSFYLWFLKRFKGIIVLGGKD